MTTIAFLLCWHLEAELLPHSTVRMQLNHFLVLHFDPGRMLSHLIEFKRKLEPVDFIRVLAFAE